MDHDVVDSDCRHPRHERFPFGSAIQRDIKSKLRAYVKQIFIPRILLNHVHGAPLRKIVDEGSPRGAVIFRHEQVRLQIIQSMSVNCEVTRSGVVARRLDTRDVVSIANAWNVLRNVGPGCAAVTTDLNVAVVSAYPKYAWHLRRFCDGYDVAITRVAVVLRRHRIFSTHAHDGQSAAIDRLG